MKRSKKLSILTILLAAVMMFTCMPVFAADGEVNSEAELLAAIAAAPKDGTATTITLGSSFASKGLDIAEGQNIILDLNGNELTLNDAIGSPGTESQGVRTWTDSAIEIKNGTIKTTTIPGGHKIQFMFANYGTMVLDSVNVVPGNGPDDYVTLVVNNRGNLTLKGNTTIPNAPTGWKIAITNDIYNFKAQDAVLNIQSSGVTVGVVEIEKYTNTQNNGDVVLNISAGNIEAVRDCADNDQNATTETVGNITGGNFKEPVKEEYLADGLEAIPDGNGGFVVEVPHTHSYSIPKAKDAKTHTAKCDCGATLTSEHSIKDGACTDCGYKAGSIVPSSNPQTSNESGMRYAAVLMLAGLALALTAKKCR